MIPQDLQDTLDTLSGYVDTICNSRLSIIQKLQSDGFGVLDDDRLCEIGDRLSVCHVDTYVVSTDSPQFYARYTVIAGGNLELSAVKIPQIPYGTYDRMDPSEWNPVLGDTKLSIYYEMQSVIVSYHENKKFVLYLDANGGTLDTEHGQSSYQMRQEDEYPTIYDPSRTGNTFVGWSLSSQEGSETIDVSGQCPFSSDTTIYAQWNAQNYNVILHLNGGEIVS